VIRILTICLLQLLFLTIAVNNAHAQPLSKNNTFNRQDTLRGTLNNNRSWWNVLHYNIYFEPDYSTKTIKGNCAITFRTTQKGNTMQIDLQQPLEIDSILLTISSSGTKNKIHTIAASKLIRNENIAIITVPAMITGTVNILTLYYHGKPTIAARPPWDGGLIWSKDKNNNPWISVACQGLGASVWYPCKDHQSDEPDNGARLNIVAPDSLAGIGNGKLIEKKNNNNGTTTWSWEVKNPINNYNIIPYIGKYANFTEVFKGAKGNLDCSYWVLEENLEAAKEQFKQVAPMLTCFEHWFGPYPFYEDSYKLVESPHLGMEHQSAVAYGNKYKNGYLGRDLSGSGWGTKWDFILVHESGHEWFGNNITTKDIADMWVHEGFTNYSETIFTQHLFGKEAGNDYLTGIRKNILNDIPIIGPYGVNKEGSADMYYKGSNMIHTIRQIINNDEKFRKLLKGLNTTFYHKTTTSRQVEEYISKQSGIDFSKVFDQYLRTTKVPVLEYKIKNQQLHYRWTNCIKDFRMPVKIAVNGTRWIKPQEKWQSLKLDTPKGQMDSLYADRNFYITVKEVD
jgi:aminopeptidase N